MTAEYEALLHQVEAVCRAIDDVVPQRFAGMHPKLVYLYEINQSMRAFFIEAQE